ncbi:hypothetical protein PVK06_036047 [Gossypium arboreum]|uniref:Uncharacterized protein n=1 Tax=Gossypium arboreum TaxID=29729 RepID=A0ABR0NIU6_GOSAR|nr:hypothetical protein PVK06_036047 [Gossypium arboreum]
MNQTFAFRTIPRPPYLVALTSTCKLSQASSAKESWNSVGIHCSYSGKSFRCCIGSKGLNRDRKRILQSLFLDFGSTYRPYLPQLTVVAFKDDDKDGNETKYDWESILKSKSNSKLLFQVQLFSKLGFLCNMAYVLPNFKAMDGLHLFTSSGSKAEAKPNTGAKLEVFNSEEAMDCERKFRIHPSTASKTMAAAAFYIWLRSKDLSLTPDLHSFHSSPFQLFTYDDPSSHTLIFVIQWLMLFSWLWGSIIRRF